MVRTDVTGQRCDTDLLRRACWNVVACISVLVTESRLHHTCRFHLPTVANRNWGSPIRAITNNNQYLFAALDNGYVYKCIQRWDQTAWFILPKLECVQFYCLNGRVLVKALRASPRSSWAFATCIE